ncbi:phosphotransferase family protein [Nocardia transvalensis]|uniref:phosphotransferase family protein n=1 Tax=Nocardia transvalensis TaxID=37333 RepID=UPI00189307D2|nr:phosphotransferase [Nocardia transvalensis]MBF6331316.1 aminoglycoside phosphotransferase family protein [Nocardia transvalensis]
MSLSTTDSEMRTVVRAACLLAGIDADDSEPVRLGARPVYRLPGGVVARVHRPGQGAQAQRTVASARWLRWSGVDAVQPLSGVRQPLQVHDRAVTFWRELPPHRPAAPAQTAAALAHVHSLPLPPELDLGLVEPFAPLEHRIRAVTTLGEDDRRWLREHLGELRDRWTALPAGRPWCVIHGDATTGAVVATTDGRVVVRRLDRLMIGPPEWDLVPTALELMSLGWTTAHHYAEFCHAYGYDVVRWAGYFLLRDIRELHLTLRAARPGHRSQALHRLSCLRGDEGPRPWPGWRRLRSHASVLG